MSNGGVLKSAGGVIGTHRRQMLLGMVTLGTTTLAGCNDLPGAGPTVSEVRSSSISQRTAEKRFALIDVDQNIVSIMEKWGAASLQGSFGRQQPTATQA